MNAPVTVQMLLNFQERGHTRRDVMLGISIGEGFDILDSAHLESIKRMVASLTADRRDWRQDDVRFKVRFTGRVLCQKTEEPRVLGAVCEGVDRMFIPTAQR